LDIKREVAWIRARATAEAIKSECFRYAAKRGVYSGERPEVEIGTRLDMLTEEATREGLTPLADRFTTLMCAARQRHVCIASVGM
jgi:hypothetical protein